ncbi:DUF4148 domain-containing protein [Burkholderia sp. BCC1998]|uniref:DUF4148 domain-containing protein n=1 Tax=Burkholderia sp. BCC1998 TaxID=2817447 RepID=UPI002AB7C624|nr:DUF4148 domain-containing protein [Burkholderia sp. BCC1998]
MKRNLHILIIAVGLAAPIFASAQSLTKGPTREQVRQEMIEYAAAGFNPAHLNPATWVDDARAASAKVAAGRVAVAHSSQWVASSESSNCD